MRILLISHGAGPYGAEQVLLALAEGLAERDHDVILELPHPGPAADAAERMAGLDVIVGGRRRLPRSRGEIPGFLGHGIRDIRSLRRLIRDAEPDVTWVNSLYSPWAALAAGFAGPPVIWHLHERSLPQPAEAVMAALMAVTTDRVVAVSHHLGAAFRRYPWLRSRMRVIRNPLLGSWSGRDREPESPFTVGFIGQLEPEKRVQDLIDALARLDHACGVLVGDGKGREAVDAAIRRSGLGERIDRVGFQRDVRPYLARFHCLAIPSSHEGFGLVGLEAMASGVPVVAARSGALPEVLGDAALYHAACDPGDLARQLTRLRERPSLRAELAKKGLVRTRDFRKDTWLDSVEALLGELRPSLNEG